MAMRTQMVTRTAMATPTRMGTVTRTRTARCAHFPAPRDSAPWPPVVGTDGGQEFTRVILGDEMELDVDRARLDVLEAGHALVAQHADVGAIVLECTNMVPYAADLQAETGLPVFSIETFVTWFQSALTPRRFEGSPPNPAL